MERRHNVILLVEIVSHAHVVLIHDLRTEEFATVQEAQHFILIIVAHLSSPQVGLVRSRIHGVVWVMKSTSPSLQRGSTLMMKMAVRVIGLTSLQKMEWKTMWKILWKAPQKTRWHPRRRQRGHRRGHPRCRQGRPVWWRRGPRRGPPSLAGSQWRLARLLRGSALLFLQPQQNQSADRHNKRALQSMDLHGRRIAICCFEAATSHMRKGS